MFHFIGTTFIIGYIPTYMSLYKHAGPYTVYVATRNGNFDDYRQSRWYL